MFIDKRKYNETLRFSYELLKPDGYFYDEADKKYIQLYQSMGYIEILRDNIHFKLSDADTLELTIPKYTQTSYSPKQPRFSTIENPFWTRCKNDYVIEISNNITDEKQRFLIESIEKNDGSDGVITKVINARSLEVEFQSKMLRNYKSVDEKDIDIEKPQKLRDILERLNEKYMDSTWSVGFIDANVSDKYRTYDFAEGSIFKFHGELEKSFCCLFKYDTINKVINVYDFTVYPVCPNCHKAEDLLCLDNTIECYNPECHTDAIGVETADGVNTIEVTDKEGNKRIVLAENGEKLNWKSHLYGRDTGLYLTETNYISEFTENTNIEDIVTRLYVYGKDDLQINTADGNYAGQSYIENYSFFRNRNYMTQELLDALDKYDKLYESTAGDWNALNEESYRIKRKLSNEKVISKDQRNLLDDLQYEINVITHLYSIQTDNKITESIKELRAECEKILEGKDFRDLSGEDKQAKLNNILKKFYDETTQNEDKIIDTGEALKTLIDDFEIKFDPLKKKDFTAEDLKDYSLGQLDEALDIYNARINALNNISKNIISADLRADLTTGTVWGTKDKIRYRVIQGDVNDNTASVIIPSDGEFNEIILTEAHKNKNMFTVPISSLYTPELRKKDNVHLQVWVSKYIEDTNKYDDVVLQTENAQYYVVWDKENSHYNIVQNNVDILGIRKIIEKARDAKQKIVDELEGDQKANEEEINKLQLTLAKETCIDENDNKIFTPELIMELNKYIKERVYTNTDIGVADITEDVEADIYRQRVNELYIDAQTAFYSMYTPTVTFDIDIVNFLRDIRCQYDWHRLSLGDMIHIGHREADSNDYVVRVVEIKWSPSDTKINLTLSNQSKYRTYHDVLVNLMNNVSYASSTISVNKENWNKAEANAVDTILNNAFDAAATQVVAGDNQNVIVDKRGITIVNSLDNNKQSRFMDNLLTFTGDNWNSTKTAISNGNIHAENLVGGTFVGKNLFIKATTADEKMMTFRVDGQGVLLDNGNFTLKNMNNKGDGNNVNMDFERGIVVTQNDSKTRVIINAIDGLCIQKGDGQGTPEDALDSEHWTDKPVKINTDGDAVFGGDIHAKRLFLQELGGENIITYIDKDKNSYKNSSTYKSDADEVKLSGEYLEGRGLKAYDRYNNLRVKIDGNDGSLSMYNGYIEMEDDNGNSLYIDPEDFLVWIVSGKKKFYYDKATNSLKFEGTIDTTDDGIFGANLTVGRVNETPAIHLEGMSGDICTIACDGGGDKSTTINSAGHLILKSSLGAYLGSASDDNNKIVTQGDLKDIQKRLSNIEIILSSLS